MPRCSIVIPVYNKAALTRQCLEALFRTSGAADTYEVIVVDDASKDETQSMLKQYGDRVKAVVHPENRGFATSCNDGAAASTGEYVIFLNNDTIPKPGWLEALSRYADEHPLAAAVGAKLLFPNETIEHAGMAIRQDRLPVHIYAGFPSDHPAVNKSRRFQILTGACLLIRRKSFDEVKGFDTAFLNSHEDVDLCLRLGKAGHEIHFCHASELYHLEMSTREANSPSEDRNARLYMDRWGDQVRPDDFAYYLEDGLITANYSLQYPIRISVSPQLALPAAWTEPHKADRMLYDRSREVHDLIQTKKRLENKIRELEAKLQLSSPGASASPAANVAAAAENAGLVESLTGRLEEMRGLLMQAHEQLLLRDEMQLETDQIVAAEMIKRLAGFLEQLDTAVERLYRSSRWRFANPVAVARRLLSRSEARLPGYGRIDAVLNSYKAWRDKHPILMTNQKPSK